jgi:hypothetical protein
MRQEGQKSTNVQWKVQVYVQLIREKPDRQKIEVWHLQKKIPRLRQKQETREQPSTPVRMRRILNLSPEEAFQIKPVKMKSKGQRRLHIEEPENFEDAKTEECWRRAMDEELEPIRGNKV